MKKIDIVIGAGFGDEGKGVVVNSLIKQPKDTLIIRFNGGQQAGHHVVHNKTKHTFSNFGSGTLKDVPTLWSKYCTIDPIGFMEELKILKDKGFIPEIFMNENCMITTPMDKVFNQINDTENEHGSVGVGFGETIKRNEQHFRLYLRDLYYPVVMDTKIKLMLKYYHLSGKLAHKESIEKFKIACKDMLMKINSVKNIEQNFHLNKYKHLIFEGAQGIMLDPKYGFFPHVTRSNCTSENALEIINISELRCSNITTFYVTRAYQTRHGNGPMTTKLTKDERIMSPHETNTYSYQGEFRKGILDVDLVDYAIKCDTEHNFLDDKVLVVTCLDQVSLKFPVKINGKKKLVSFGKFKERFEMPVIGCYSNKGF